MKKITVFLASSKELKVEREQFEIEIYRKCKLWFERGLFLHLDVWEDLSARISDTRSQDEYNQKIKESDLFILLAYSKVGMYTAEEFDKAFGAFKETRKPFIFTYFKAIDGDTEPSLQQFQQRLSALDHFYSHFTDVKDLWHQFNKELDRLEQAEFKKNKHLGEKNSANRTISLGEKSMYIENAKDTKINIQ